MSLTIVTPDSDGKIRCAGETTGILPASTYLEGDVSSGVSYIQDIFQNHDQISKLAGSVSYSSVQLARELARIISGKKDDSFLPITLDMATYFVEQITEKALRAAGFSGFRMSFNPSKILFELDVCKSGKHYKQLQKKQWYQWFLLRSMLGANDPIKWIRPSIFSILRQRFKPTIGRSTSAPVENKTLFFSHIGRHESFFRKMGFPIAEVPQLVRTDMISLQNSKVRTSIKEAIDYHLEDLLRNEGLPHLGIRRCARIFSKLFPVSRVENFTENLERYEKFFDHNKVAGFVTETGQGKYDPNMFFWSVCNLKELPSLVIQHGGQYGYDNKISGFFTVDGCQPTHFASWGWTEFPSNFNSFSQRSKVTPLPSLKLSTLVQKEQSHIKKNKKILLIPLSKFRTLDNRFGGNATDGVVLALRSFVATVINRVVDQFDEVIITHRGKTFEHDVFAGLLEPGMRDRINIMPSERCPVNRSIGYVTAVLWDVTATGMWETTTANVPTVVLFREGRWAPEARHYEEMFLKSGIGVRNIDEAVNSLNKFSQHPEAWEKARAFVQPALDKFALTSISPEERWRPFLKKVFFTNTAKS